MIHSIILTCNQSNCTESIICGLWIISDCDISCTYQKQKNQYICPLLRRAGPVQDCHTVAEQASRAVTPPSCSCTSHIHMLTAASANWIQKQQKKKSPILVNEHDISTNTSLNRHIFRKKNVLNTFTYFTGKEKKESFCVCVFGCVFCICFFF